MVGECMKYSKCLGEGYGSCTRCSEQGRWNVSWMCFLYKIENRSGCYCYDCVKEIAQELNEELVYIKE